MFWFDDGELAALIAVWMVFMIVVGVYVIRIGIMLAGQRAMERSYRLRLAMIRGRTVRAGTPPHPENALPPAES